MLLCQACQTIPFRSIFRHLAKDPTAREAFEWYHTPGSSSKDESLKRGYVRWHATLEKLKENAASCPLCHVLHSPMQANWRYQSSVQENERRAVWLEVPHRNPTCKVWIGDERPEALVSGNYRFNTTPDNPVAQFFSDFAVLEDTLHPAVLRQMDNWVEDCDEKHSACTHLKSRLVHMPTRVLNLSMLPTRKDMDESKNDWDTLFSNKACKLVENSPGTTGRYVALSYCWGKSLAYTTTTKNLETHKNAGGIQFSQLPRTLQDALMIVRYLGLDYLWADCLCIVQDDKDDWEHEAAHMADVYSNAYLTVAATRASHCGEGFLQPRKVNIGKQVHIEDQQGSFDLYFKYDDCTMSPGSMESIQRQPLRLQREEPLVDRVWCFQERVLASRTLHFATDQMYYECASIFAEEAGITRTCTSDDFYKEYSLDTIAKDRDAWYRVVQEYTSRNITYQSDKLPALSGVVSALQKITGDTCYVGIWRSWFIFGLLWRVQVPGEDIYVFAAKEPHAVEKWRAPSWSFAAIEGVVLYDILQRAVVSEHVAQLEDCRVVPSGRNLLGEVKEGYVRIKGPMTTLEAVDQVHIGHGSNGRACRLRLKGQRHVYAGVYFDLKAYDTCQVLMLTSSSGLALRLVDAEKSTYVRVGAVMAYMRNGITDDAGELITSAEEKTSLSASDHLEACSITIV